MAYIMCQLYYFLTSTSDIITVELVNFLINSGSESDLHLLIYSEYTKVITTRTVLVMHLCLNLSINSMKITKHQLLCQQLHVYYKHIIKMAFKPLQFKKLAT